MSDKAITDELLLLAAGKGDLAAFAEIVRRHQAWAWKTAYRFLGRKEEAEDVVQDAFLKILDAAPRYSPRALFRTYLYSVLIRLCIDRNRKKRPLTIDDIEERQGLSPDPQDGLAEKERRASVRKAIDALPANQKTAVILRHFDDLSYIEIAQVLGTTVKSVEGLIGRARSALRTLLVDAG